MKTKRKLSWAFTLVELLVVMAIIGMLVALIFPALSGARLQARRSQCLSNVKQITAGVFLYSSSHNLRLPYPDTFMELGGGQGASATNRPLLQYIDDQAVFECRADKGAVWPSSTAAGQTAFATWGSSYAYARTTLPVPGGTITGVVNTATSPPEGLRMSTFRAPSRKVVVFEPPYGRTGGLDNREKWHHNTERASVMGFLDGHAAFVMTNDFVSGNYF